MRHLLTAIILMVASLFSSTVYSTSNALEQILTPYEATYELTWMGMNVGESLHRLANTDADTFYFETQSQPHLSLIPYYYHESSRFKTNNQTLIPLSYFFDLKEGTSKKVGTIHFDWKTLKATLKSKKNQKEYSLHQGMQDKITQLIMLRKDLLERKKTFSYQVTEPKTQRTYQYSILGKEVLHTALGDLETLKVQYKTRSRITTFWVAEKFDYLTVRLEQHRKGKLVASGQIVDFKLLGQAQ